jgi:hypothetical protein
MLPVGNQIIPSKSFDGERSVLDALIPGEEVLQIVTVSAKRCGREVILLQAGEKPRHPV